MKGRASQVNLRYALSSITEETWDQAIRVTGVPAPAEPGSPESFVVPDLDIATTYFFAMKIVDEVGNLSTLSNVVSLSTTTDAVPPSQVTDLTAVFATTRRISLTWTAPGNDGTVGQAAAYDLRMASTPITEETWGLATPVPGVPNPSISGTLEHFVVTGLESAMEYAFALRARDEVDLESEVSNSASGSTAASSLRLTFSFGAGAKASAWSPTEHGILYFGGDLINEQVSEFSFLTGGSIGMTLIANARYPAWSPDGSQIVFTARDDNGSSTLWLMPPSQYAEPSPLVSEGADRSISKSSWSPDGSRVAYSVAEVPPTTSQIRIVPALGGASELVVGHASRNSWPAWSPDGTRIAFTSNRTGDSEIWVVGVDGGGLAQLTFDPAVDSSPAWSPDGTRIAFYSNRSGNYDIWVMSATGETPIQLDDDPASDADPCWSPDGREISFTSNRAGLNDIWVMPVP
jgi:hypothetical protein